MKICRVNEVRELDRRAVQEFSIREELLMENAGLAVFSVLQNMVSIEKNKFVVFCGVGNNGGDGFVIARKIHSDGGKVIVLIIGDRSKFKGVAKFNLDIILKLPVKIIDVKNASAVKEHLGDTTVIIDAIFGTGLDRQVTGIYYNVINIINASNKLVLSIDIPSGINGDTGQVMGKAIRAQSTVTFGLPKLGNMLYPGYDQGGKLYLSHISFPPVLYNSDMLKIATNDPVPIPERDPDTHKGACGKVLIIAGSSNYLGAPYFSSVSFLKSGGGLAFLATPDKISSTVAKKGKELVLLPQKSTASGSISLENFDDLLQFSEEVDMVVLGPGLSLNEETQSITLELTRKINKPLLIDGDGITAISEDLACVKKRKDLTILTPHLGEMARITKKEIKEVNDDKINLLQDTCSSLKSIIVLKGAHSLIGYPDRTIFINLSGNPGMATAGSGDVLTGTIAAMFGSELTINDAVRMGVFVHGFAGDLAADEKGEDGIIAGDIMNKLPLALKKLRGDFASIEQDHYHSIFKVL
jgi:hydroxyethylthiazole kinase-like uncharacterized protein yjeF